LDQLDRADRQPEQIPQVKIQDLKGKLSKVREQLKILWQFEEDLEMSPDGRICQTDPNTR